MQSCKDEVRESEQSLKELVVLAARSIVVLLIEPRPDIGVGRLALSIHAAQGRRRLSR